MLHSVFSNVFIFKYVSLLCCAATTVCISVLSHIDKGCTISADRYRATVYPCPEKLEERRDMLANLGARIADLQIVSTDCIMNTTVKEANI